MSEKRRHEQPDEADETGDRRMHVQIHDEEAADELPRGARRKSRRTSIDAEQGSVSTLCRVLWPSNSSSATASSSAVASTQKECSAIFSGTKQEPDALNEARRRPSPEEHSSSAEHTGSLGTEPGETVHESAGETPPSSREKTDTTRQETTASECVDILVASASPSAVKRWQANPELFLLTPRTVERLQRLGALLPGRYLQVCQLAKHSARAMDATLPLAVYGHTATGKTVVLRGFLEALCTPFAFLNCIECFSISMLLEQALNQLVGHELNMENRFTNFKSCSSLSTFVRTLRVDPRVRSVVGPVGTHRTTYLVFDQAERLRSLPDSFFAGLLSLRQLTGLNVCPIFISQVAFTHYAPPSVYARGAPLSIFFPMYSMDELIEIISLHRPPEWNATIFKHVIKAIYWTFRPVTLSLEEIRYITMQMYPVWYAPISRGEIGEQEYVKQSVAFGNQVREHLSNVYMHHRVRLDSSGEQEGDPSSSVSSASNQHFDMPRYTKLLLLAAFLASHIRASGDRQLFGSDSTTRRRGNTREKRLTLVEPRAFPVERMLAIFFNLTADWGERVPNTAELYFQISNLVRINLLDRVSAADRLGGVKLKANIDTQFATQLATGINFPLHDYIT